MTHNICANCRFRAAEPGSEYCPECAAGVRTPHRIPKVSHQDETLDALVEAASIPNLGALIKRGKEKGLIKAKQAYVNTAGS